MHQEEAKQTFLPIHGYVQIAKEQIPDIQEPAHAENQNMINDNHKIAVSENWLLF